LNGSPSNAAPAPSVDAGRLDGEVVPDVRPLDGSRELHEKPSNARRKGKPMSAVQEQEADRAQVLIESKSGRFGCSCVQHLACEERLDLLERARADGWELITRGVHWFDKADHKGNVVGEEPSEYWYFRRLP